MNDLALDVILTLLVCSSSLLKWKLFASRRLPPVFSLLLGDVTDSETHSDIWQRNIALQVSPDCLLSSPLSSFSSHFFPPAANVQSRQTHAPALPHGAHRGLIGWCLVVVTLLSLNQSFRRRSHTCLPASFPDCPHLCFPHTDLFVQWN